MLRAARATPHPEPRHRGLPDVREAICRPPQSRTMQLKSQPLSGPRISDMTRIPPPSGHFEQHSAWACAGSKSSTERTLQVEDMPARQSMEQLGIKLQQELAKSQVTIAFRASVPSKADRLQAAPAAQWKQLQPLWSVTFNTSSAGIACRAFHFHSSKGAEHFSPRQRQASKSPWRAAMMAGLS